MTRSSNPRDVRKQAVRGFIKVFSCSHSMILTLMEDADIDLLKASTGLGAGLSTMGDICGMVNGGALVLGERLASESSDWEIAVFCNEFYQRVKQSVGTCSCGEVHGGKHLARNFRRAILTGKTAKCLEMLYKGSGILDELTDTARTESLHFDPERRAKIEEMCQHFQSKGFHCCRSTLQRIHEASGLDTSPLDKAVAGFVGGIGFSGTLCGAVVGGVLALGLKHGVDPRDSSYRDTWKIIYQGLIKSDRIWSDEKVFRPAKTFGHCQTIYRAVEQEYGDCDCSTISGLDINSSPSVQEYMEEGNVEYCERLSAEIARLATQFL